MNFMSRKFPNCAHLQHAIASAVMAEETRPPFECKSYSALKSYCFACIMHIIIQFVILY